jgi:adenylate cyclase
MGLVAELKRRNVIRVAVAYAVIAWVIAQIAELAFDSFDAPGWVLKSVLVILALGFPLALFFAWAFELTPEGVKKQAEVDISKSITQSTGRKLDYLIIAVLVIAVGMLLVDKFVLQDTSTPLQEVAVADVTADKSLAVLPFVAMSNGPDDGYFADGLTEEILNSLAQVPELLVTARTSAFSFKGQDIPIPEIAATLGVAHVVEGSVRRAGEQLRITAQLIRARDGFHLWSETYDRSSADSFGVQGEIAEKIAAALDVVLDDAQLEKMKSSGLRSPEAFIAFQKGLELYATAHEVSGIDQPAALALANEQFDKALALEPDSSVIHFRHADFYIHAAALPTDEAGRAASNVTMEAAKSDLQKAVRYARGDGERLNASLEYTLIAREWRRLPELFRSALQLQECLSPSWWGAIGPFTEPLQDMIALWERARACDPLNFYPWTNKAGLQTTQGDFAAAIATATEGLKRVTHRQIADALIVGYVGAGQYDDALAANERLIENPGARGIRRMKIEAARGDAEQVRVLYRELLETQGNETLGADMLAVLGKRDLANQIAAAADARPLGFLDLLDAADSCKCGAPFDLEFTPNFARLIDEAKLVWPPRRPIEWPLKDW